MTAQSFLFLIKVYLTCNIVLASGVHVPALYLCTSWRDHRTMSSHHLSLHKVVTTVLTIFSVH